MAAVTTNLNEKIKKKLLALSENIRRNLLLANGNVQRKFVLEERDFLSILILAIQHLNKQPTQTTSITNNDGIEENKEQEHINTKQKETSELDKTESNETNHLKHTNEKPDIMGKGGGKTEDCDLDNSEKLRKELIRILDSTSFNSDCKSHLIVDVYNRYQKQINLAKEREILNSHLKSHPNVLIGGGENSKGTKNNETDDSSESAIHTSEHPSSSTHPPAKNPPTTKNVRDTSAPLANPVDIWINDAVTVITSYMKNKVNVIFLENLQNHASKLRAFLKNKGNFDKENNRIQAPHGRFFLKKSTLYFKIKSAQHLQSFDLATLMACISLSKSKLFRFLQYRFEKVKAFSKKEKQCLHIFLNTCPISRQRIPCKTIRDLAKS